MTEPNIPVNSSSPVGEEGSRLDQLEQELQKLKTLLEGENKGLVGWAKRWGAILALIMALFAVPRGVVDAYRVFWSRPNTELVNGKTLTMGYDPDGRIVSFAVEFGATNTGTRDDFVRDMTGSVQNNSAPEATLIPFGIPDIDCLSEGTKVDLPFPIRTAASTNIACTFASKLGKPVTGPFAHAGSYRLAMNVSGMAKESRTLTYCFDLDDKTLTEFFGSTKLQSARFLYPDCNQVGTR